MRTMAVSATDSVHAEALLQYTVPCAARERVSTQSKPAPAEAKILQEEGRREL
jgi:hypothetical protein